MTPMMRILSNTNQTMTYYWYAFNFVKIWDQKIELLELRKSANNNGISYQCRIRAWEAIFPFSPWFHLPTRPFPLMLRDHIPLSEAEFTLEWNWWKWPYPWPRNRQSESSEDASYRWEDVLYTLSKYIWWSTFPFACHKSLFFYRHKSL